jgi:predicted Rossmann-fold nucleotide-binding protein
MIVIGIFGGTEDADDAENLALWLGTEMLGDTKLMVLTGGFEPGERGAKNKALEAPDAKDRGWVGVTQEGFIEAKPKGVAGLILHTDLGHRRNYLEACLVDAAIALPGLLGTVSEAVATLCLGKRVVFVGDRWLDGSLLSSELIRITHGNLLTKSDRDHWIDLAKQRFLSDDATQIEKLISENVVAENLVGSEPRIRHLPTAQRKDALATVSVGIPESHEFPDIGQNYRELANAYECHVRGRNGIRNSRSPVD